jgi:hypothetical protein
MSVTVGAACSSADRFPLPPALLLSVDISLYPHPPKGCRSDPVQHRATVLLKIAESANPHQESERADK